MILDSILQIHIERKHITYDKVRIEKTQTVVAKDFFLPAQFESWTVKKI